MISIAVYYKIHEGIESSENYDEKQKKEPNFNRRIKTVL